MTLEQLTEKVREAQARWQELRDKWSDLGLPGSHYMPNEFFAALLLLQVQGDTEEIATRVREGHSRLQQLQKAGVFGGLIGDTEKMMIIALALVDQQVPVAVAPVSVLPIQPVPAAPVVEPAPQTTPASVSIQNIIDRCPHCGHRFECCAEGHYGLKPFEHALAHGKKLPVAGCEHVGLDGKCATCTDDKTTKCSGGCDDDVVISKATKCKDEDCDHHFCDGCKDDGLSEWGYCEDCNVWTCDDCGNEIDCGTEKMCANPECQGGDGYCDECAQQHFNDKGLCEDCA